MTKAIQMAPLDTLPTDLGWFLGTLDQEALLLLLTYVENIEVMASSLLVRLVMTEIQLTSRDAAMTVKVSLEAGHV